jgi:alkylresorcinol/alkylpyrone synthase
MTHIAAVATAVPEHVLTQSRAREFAASYFRIHNRDVERLLPVFDHAGIETRHISMPPAWFLSPHTFAEKNNRYIEESTRLGSEVLRKCSEQSGIGLGEITHLIYVSTTGLATPSIDSRLLNVLGLSPNIVRTPVWGLGCAGGAAGLALAHRLAKGDPEAVIALVCVELCSLTFHFEDFSKSNVIATALFGDGAAGVLVVGDDRAKRLTHAGPSVLAVGTTTWPDSLDVMGWNFDAVGMQVVFSQSIPQVVREKVHDNTVAFLSTSGHSFEDVAHWIVHPGGTKVMEAYEAALPLPPCALTHARESLREFGNMSSPTVLFVLDRLLRKGKPRPGELGLLTALGPGFSSENLLLQF